MTDLGVNYSGWIYDKSYLKKVVQIHDGLIYSWNILKGCAVAPRKTAMTKFFSLSNWVVTMYLMNFYVLIDHLNHTFIKVPPVYLIYVYNQRWNEKNTIISFLSHISFNALWLIYLLADQANGLNRWPVNKFLGH